MTAGRDAWRRGTLLLLLAGVVFALLTFDVHGPSNDEEVQHVYGRLLLDFYASGFQDQRAFGYLNLRHYGGLFDMLAALLEPRVRLGVWDLRHLLSAGFGLAGVWAAALTARSLRGWRAGFLAAALLLLCAPWSGAMFTHTKDVTFGACMAWALYGTVRIAQSMPRPSPWLATGTGLAIGAALGLRFGAFLAALELVLACAIAIALSARSGTEALAAARTALPRLLTAGVVAFACMALFWPWSVTGWDHVLQTTRAFSHYEFDLLTVLDGTLHKAREVPASYLPRYLLVRLPEVMLLGLGLAPLALLRGASPARERWCGLAPVLLAALLPLAIAILTRPALYNGVRHFTFLLPPFAVLAALGLDALLESTAGRRAARLAAVLLLALPAADTAVTLARLHPYEYVAYNRLAAGLPGAFDQYETDYWSDSLRPLVARLNAMHGAEAATRERPFRVAACAEIFQLETWLAPGFEVTRDWPSADFFLSSTQNNCDSALQGPVTAEVSRLGVPLAVLKDRRGLTGAARRVL